MRCATLTRVAMLCCAFFLFSCFSVADEFGSVFGRFHDCIEDYDAAAAADSDMSAGADLREGASVPREE